MSTMQQALREIGFKAQNLVLFTTSQRLENNLDAVFEPLAKVRKLQITRAGSHYRARWEGESFSCFGETPNEAAKRLSYLPRCASGRQKYEGVTQ